MILPESRPEEARKRGLLALGTTTVVVALIVLVLTASKLPSADDMRAAYRQIDLTVFEEQRPEEEEDPEEAEEPEEVEDPEPTPTPEVQQTQQQPQRIEVDLSALEFTEPEPQTPAERDRPDPGTEGQAASGLALNELGDLSALDALEGTGNNLPSASGRRTGSGGGGLGLEGGLGSGLGDGLGGGGLAGGGDLGGIGGRDEPSGQIDVGEVDLSEFGNLGGDVDIDNLGPYLRANGKDLPDAVKRLMQRGNWTSDLLSTKVRARMPNGRGVDLYLMYKEGLRELHILVVEGNKATYIVDRARQGQGRLMRQGTVGRTNGVITVIDNRQVEASAARTKPYYDTFSNWWAGVK